MCKHDEYLFHHHHYVIIITIIIITITTIILTIIILIKLIFITSPSSPSLLSSPLLSSSPSLHQLRRGVGATVSVIRVPRLDCHPSGEKFQRRQGQPAAATHYHPTVQEAVHQLAVLPTEVRWSECSHR